jgi:DNA replication and repair protein RecF
MIRYTQPHSRIFALCERKSRDITAEIKLSADRKKQIKISGVPLEKDSQLYGIIPGVLFTPDHLSLVKAGPGLRRLFIDMALCQIKPAYIGRLIKYNHILHQRNALLKKGVTDTQSLLDVWDESLSHAALGIIKTRAEYILEISEIAAEIYGEISGTGTLSGTLMSETLMSEADALSGTLMSEAGTLSGERLRIEYHPSINGAENLTKEDIIAVLYKSRPLDIRTRVTNKGPHRDDLYISVSGRDARQFASQGQQRSVVLALKLAEAALLAECYGEEPIILLDDVMSELDAGRQDYILRQTQNRQVIVTCCEPGILDRGKDATKIYIKNGEIT